MQQQALRHAVARLEQGFASGFHVTASDLSGGVRQGFYRAGKNSGGQNNRLVKVKRLVYKKPALYFYLLLLLTFFLGRLLFSCHF
ncbi:MAG: hypothetical protein ACREUY_07100 [Burkholderiales bacterium]